MEKIPSEGGKAGGLGCKSQRLFQEKTRTCEVIVNEQVIIVKPRYFLWKGSEVDHIYNALI